MAKSTPCGIVQRLVADANRVAMLEEGVEEKWGAPELYGSHSLRRGGVTEARASGVEMLEIQRHGRWKSMAVWGYVGPTDAQRRQVTANIFSAGAHKKSLSAPNTPVKLPKPQRTPRASPVKPKRKRAAADDDEEKVTEEAKEIDRVDEIVFMEALQQGYREEELEEETKKKAVKKLKSSSKKADGDAQPMLEEEVGAASTPSPTPRRQAAKAATEKMTGQR